MADYRAYMVDKEGHFKAFEAIHAPDDERALKTAEKFVDGCDVEVWKLDRKIAVLNYKK
jgi:1,2-phenylacetyl-CoA epoxidase PaaB subunit